MRGFINSDNKKNKIVSILASVAMVASTVLSAVPFEASAESNPVGLELTSEKTQYSLEEIQRGATATVYIDVNTEIGTEDGVVGIELGLKPREGWGMVDPVNLMLNEPNQLRTETGSYFEYDEIDGSASYAASNWTKEMPETYFSCLNYSEETEHNYSDDNIPKACIISNSVLGNFSTDGDGEHLAEFDVEFPVDLAAGTYTIDFFNAKVLINLSTDINGLTTEEITNTHSITFTIGNTEEVTTAETQETEVTLTEVTTAETQETEVTLTEITTAETQETEVTLTEATTVETTEVTANQTVTTVSNDKLYVGEAKIWAEDGIEAQAGGKVYVPVYINTYGQTIEGVAFKVVYDDTALDLTSVIHPKKYGYAGIGLSGGTLRSNPQYDVVLFTYKSGPITNNPEHPVCVLEFAVNENVLGEYSINFINDAYFDNPIEIVQAIGSEDTTYLTPVVDGGSVVIVEELLTTVTTTAATTTTTTTTTTSVTTTETTTTTLITTVTTEATTHKVSGDVNKDGETTMADAVIVQKYLLNIYVVFDRNTIDVNGDNKVNVFDFIFIKRIVLYE